MVTAFVLITAKTGKEKEVLAGLKSTSKVDEAYLVYGDYDIVVKLEFEDLDALNSFMIEKLREIPNINSTTTLLGI